MSEGRASPAPQAPTCGCRIERMAVTSGAWTTFPAVIVSCATHAAAFRLAELVHDLVEVSAAAPTMSREVFAAAVRDPVLPRARALVQEIDGRAPRGEALPERLAEEVYDALLRPPLPGEGVEPLTAAIRTALDAAKAAICRYCRDGWPVEGGRHTAKAGGAIPCVAAAIEALKEPAR